MSSWEEGPEFTRHYRVITDAEVETIRHMYEKGMLLIDMKRATGIRKTTIAGVIDRLRFQGVVGNVPQAKLARS